MRALLTVQPSISHLHSMVPVAGALSEAGHDVVVCASASFGPEVKGFGLTHRAAGVDWLASDRSTWGAFPPPPPPGPAFLDFVVSMFADITAGAMARDLLTFAADWGPDLVIRDSMEYGGCLAAECLGIAHASVAVNGYSGIDDPAVRHPAGNRWAGAEPLARHRREFWLPPDPDVEMPFRHRHLVFAPPSWDPPGAPRPPQTRFLRFTSTIAPGARLPAWAQGSDRPTVLASLGTVFNKTPGLLEAIIEGIREDDVQLVVAIGRDQDAARFGSEPPNVRLEPFVPQALLLEHCDVFVTHGGFNSVRESLNSGTPMVVVPIAGDQHYCAQRCTALGVARTVDPADRAPEAIAGAIRQVLGDPSYATNAWRFRAEMRALPGADAWVALLEELGGRVVPSPTQA